MSSKKDVTSEERSYYFFFKNIYSKTYSKKPKEIFTDNSSYLLKKKSIAIGKPNITSFFTNNNKLEIKQAKKLLRSRG